MDYRAAEEARKNLTEVYAEFLARQAVDRIHRKDYEGAIESLKRAKDLDPDADGIRSLLSAIEETGELFSRDPKGKGK